MMVARNILGFVFFFIRKRPNLVNIAMVFVRSSDVCRSDFSRASLVALRNQRHTILFAAYLPRCTVSQLHRQRGERLVKGNQGGRTATKERSEKWTCSAVEWHVGEKQRRYQH